MSEVWIEISLYQHEVKHAIVIYVEFCSEGDWNVGKCILPYMLKFLIVILITDGVSGNYILIYNTVKPNGMSKVEYLIFLCWLS
jgi:hypothetical protein